jgi:hypothetical protein
MCNLSEARGILQSLITEINKMPKDSAHPNVVFVPISVYEPWMEKAIKHLCGDEVKIEVWLV